MEKIENLENIAVLIDADNSRLSRLKLILDEISSYGRIVVKKAYGNFKSEQLKNWEAELNSLAIKPEQQFAYTTGKNATDISLVIGALDLLYTGLYDAFVIISSDSDFTPLAIRLRESGVYVFGAGEEKTPKPFRNACDNFILTEYLTDSVIEKSKPAEKPEQISTTPVVEEAIHDLLVTACNKYQDAEGWVNVSAAGTYIKRVKPDFDAKIYGFNKLPDLLKAFPDRYKTRLYPGKGTAMIFGYKCKKTP